MRMKIKDLIMKIVFYQLIPMNLIFSIAVPLMYYYGEPNANVGWVNVSVVIALLIIFFYIVYIIYEIITYLKRSKEK